MRRRRDLEVISGLVNADGSIYSGDGFSVLNTAAGKWDLFLPDSFRPVSCEITAAADVLAFCIAVPVYSVNKFQIRLYNNAGAVLAQPWNFTAYGYRV